MHDVESFDSRGNPLATKDDNRWFCRVSIEIVPARGGKVDGGAWSQWGNGWQDGALSVGVRQEVARLAAEHVWGDPAFAGRAREQMQ